MKQPNSRNKTTLLTMQTKESIAGWIFLMPALVLMLLFVFYPMVSAGWISLHDWNMLGSMEFTGLDNFKTLIQDQNWLKCLKRTGSYTLCYVPALYSMSLVLALIVHKIPKGSGFFRTAYFMPVILSSVVTGLIWKLMYDERTGVINNIVSAFLGEKIPWLSSMKWAMPAVLIVHVWMQMGYYMIIFLAGLQDIPKEYYEAAQIDGANGWQQFWHITMPNLANTSVFVIIMSVINSFQAYDHIATLTDGGPANATNLAVQYIYETAFSQYSMGYAASLALNLFVIILAFSLLMLKVMRTEKN